jgi:tripartite-type tricarboxylate transporter receptor subunit TctC
MPAICVRALIVALIVTPILALAPFEGAAAQDFPARPVRFVVPYAAGGSGDLLARLLGSKLANIWGQQVVVDNRPGAGGLIGTEFAARSEPDGYTHYLATDGPLTIAATLYKRVPYDWKRDFAPVSMLAMGYQVLLVGRSLPARNVQQLVALARQKPGELNYASIGIGSITPPSASAAPRISERSCSSRSRKSISPTSPIEALPRRPLPRSSPATFRCFWSGPRPRFPTSKAAPCRGLP